MRSWKQQNSRRGTVHFQSETPRFYVSSDIFAMNGALKYYKNIKTYVLRCTTIGLSRNMDIDHRGVLTWIYDGPTGPRWAPCSPRESCYLGRVLFKPQCDFTTQQTDWRGWANKTTLPWRVCFFTINSLLNQGIRHSDINNITGHEQVYVPIYTNSEKSNCMDGAKEAS